MCDNIDLSLLHLTAVPGLSVQPAKRVATLRGGHRQTLQQHTGDLFCQSQLLARTRN